jgi:hypothetical protein
MNEDPKIINDTDKPLNQENIQPQKVDINVLKARAKELQDKENFRNAIFAVCSNNSCFSWSLLFYLNNL